MGRLGTARTSPCTNGYMADIAASSRTALDTVDPTPYFIKYGENTWAAVRGYLDAVAAAAATPVIEKYTGVLASADVFTDSPSMRTFPPLTAVAAVSPRPWGTGSTMVQAPLSSDY